MESALSCNSKKLHTLLLDVQAYPALRIVGSGRKEVHSRGSLGLLGISFKVAKFESESGSCP